MFIITLVAFITLFITIIARAATLFLMFGTSAPQDYYLLRILNYGLGSISFLIIFLINMSSDNLVILMLSFILGLSDLYEALRSYDFYKEATRPKALPPANEE